MVGVTNFADILWVSASAFSLRTNPRKLMSFTALPQNVMWPCYNV